MNLDAADRSRLVLSLSVLVLFSTLLPLAAQGLDARREATESGRYLWFGPSASSASASELATAMDVSPGDLQSATLSGAAAASTVHSGLGVIAPRRGSTLALLSTGIHGTPPEPGTDFSPEGSPGDEAELVLSLYVPAGPSILSFDFAFLSAEYPEFVGTEYNDVFSARVTDQNGTREIAVADVNSSFFFPASSERAGGSGYDIFAEDPDDFGTVGGNGLPDAGLTEFRSVRESILSDGSIQVRFSIADVGDGIYDSAVILDNLSFDSLEVVDAGNEAFLAYGIVSANTAVLAEGGESRVGLVADGVSSLLLRSNLPGGGTVEYCLSSPFHAPEDGGLSPIGAEERRSCVTAQVVQTSRGYQAFAVFRAPEDFNRGGDENLAVRSTGVDAVYHPSSGGSITTTRQLELHRPPVLLVHGLWSSADTWSFDLVTDSRFFVGEANYGSTAGAAFEMNDDIVFNAAYPMLRQKRAEGIAATQVDVVAHSMGGILSRLWATGGLYRRNNNFLEGDINKLITLDTPHFGSPVATLVQVIRALPQGVGTAFSGIMCLAKKPVSTYCTGCRSPLGVPVTRCAVDDLATGSNAIQGLEAVDGVPVHAMVGVGGSDLFPDVDDVIAFGAGVGVIYQILDYFSDTSLDDLFPGIQHDLIVGRLSQQGGLSGAPTQTVGGLSGIHLVNTSSDQYSARVVDLLNRSVDSSSFGTLESAGSQASSAEVGASTSSFHARFSTTLEGGLTLSLVGASPPFSPGETIRVRATATGGVSLDSALFIAGDSFQLVTSAPFEATLVVPEGAIGTLEIGAVGTSTGGELITAEPISVAVSTSSQVVSLRLIPDSLAFPSPSGVQQVSALATFSDGVERDVTGKGASFTTSEENVATVTSSGLLSAHSSGFTTLVASYGGVSTSATVEVQGGCSGGSDSLCLQSNRFQVEIEYRLHTGEAGRAKVAPVSSSDSGVFYFSNPDNWEFLLKVLDGCPLNGHYWTFFAATTDVEFTVTVTDRSTGLARSYQNAAGHPADAVTDTEAFATCGSAAATATPLPEKAPETSPRDASFQASALVPPTARATAEPSSPRTAAGSCATGPQTLCLQDGRFRVEVDYTLHDGTSGGALAAEAGSSDSGIFYFNNPANWEFLLKVLNGCPLNDRFWVFFAATTDVRFTVTVTDTETGLTETYVNSLGHPANAVTDTNAFATCSGSPPSIPSVAGTWQGTSEITRFEPGSDCVASWLNTHYLPQPAKTIRWVISQNQGALTVSQTFPPHTNTNTMQGSIDVQGNIETQSSVLSTFKLTTVSCGGSVYDVWIEAGDPNPFHGTLAPSGNRIVGEVDTQAVKRTPDGAFVGYLNSVTELTLDRQ